MKKWSAYALIVIASLSLMLFIDKQVGFTLLAAIVLAAPLSALLAFVSRAKTTAAITEAPQSPTYKQTTSTLKITVKAPLWFFSPYISIKCGSSPNIKAPFTLHSTLDGASTDFSLEFSAMHAGAGRVFAEDIRLVDFTGLFSFKLHPKNLSARPSDLNVIPDIQEISPQSEFLKQLVLSSESADDDETNNPATTESGFPGYEHRDYHPGDSLKRINWKLSAKREKLFVRLSEKLANKPLCFALCDKAGGAEANGLAIEAVLALCKILCENEQQVFLSIKTSLGWRSVELKTAADVHDLSLLLSSCTFSAEGTAFTAAEKSVVFAPTGFDGDEKVIVAAVKNPPPNSWKISSQANEIILERTEQALL